VRARPGRVSLHGLRERAGHSSRTGRVALAIACCAAALAGARVANGRFEAGAPRPVARPATQPSMVASAGARAVMAHVDASAAVAVVPPMRPPDAVDRYVAMRDDIDPTPRLQVIEAWAREAHPDGDVALLSQALVDPDASVRARAQALFDRAFEKP